jgi:hypothetical protein
MENIIQERSIHQTEAKIKAEVVWVDYDLKEIHAYSEEQDEILIFKSVLVTNIVTDIDQIEDGQALELTMSLMNEVLSARIIHTLN